MSISKKKFIFSIFVLILAFFCTNRQVVAIETVYNETEVQYIQTRSVYDGTEIPYIQDRSVWENTGNLQNLLKIKKSKTGESTVPTYYSPSKIVIHGYDCNIHLANGKENPACNSAGQDAISIIQNIYRYHVLNKGLDDIGYNFIIGWNGEIFEGRYGGNGIVGSHLDVTKDCIDYNVGTVGILLLGNIEEGSASLQIKESLAKLIAWISMGNNITPTSLSKTTKVWQYDQVKNKMGELGCDFEEGSFSTEWKSPTVGYYKDIDFFNGDYGLDLNDIRTEAIAYKKIFEKYSYRSEDSGNIWNITDGTRTSDVKLGSKTITITDSQLNYFSEPESVVIKNGSVFLIEGRNNPYVLKENICYEVISQGIFDAWKLGSVNQKIVNARNIPDCLFGYYLNYPIGQLIRADSDDKVYLVNDDSSISHISSLLTFEKLNFNWDNVTIINNQEINFSKISDSILLPSETLVRGSSPTIYSISGRTKKPFVNSQMFSLYGFNEDDIETISEQELSQYSIGQAMVYPDNTLISIGDDTYIIVKGRRNLIFNSMLSYVNTANNEPIILLEADKHTYPLGLEIREMTDITKLENMINSEKEDFVSMYANVPVGGLMRSVRVGVTKLDKGEIIKVSATQNYKKKIGQSKAQEMIAEKMYDILPEDNSDGLKLFSLSGNIVFNVLIKDERHSFTGNIEILPVKTEQNTEYWLVNELLLEDYLQGLRLIGDISEMNALKSLAIASRSYALYYIELGGRYRDLPFHIMKKEHNMYYEGFEANKNNVDFSRAVDETRGIIIFYEKTPALAIYSDDTCGISKRASQVLGSFYKKFFYLNGGIHDPAGTKHLENCSDSTGHGIGMSLVGAQVLASRRDNYVEILKYYYPSTNINKLYK